MYVKDRTKRGVIQLTEHFETNEILSSKHSDFRKRNHSDFKKSHDTAAALLDVLDGVLAARDAEEGFGFTLLDLSRAFDTVNFKLFLSKFVYYWFDSDTIKWFSSYLSVRMQRVEVLCEDRSFIFSGTASVEIPQGFSEPIYSFCVPLILRIAFGTASAICLLSTYKFMFLLILLKHGPWFVD